MNWNKIYDGYNYPGRNMHGLCSDVTLNLMVELSGFGLAPLKREGKKVDYVCGGGYWYIEDMDKREWR